MLEREILKIDYGVSYGSSTLKSLQNDNIPELDLLIREAIQNSSDASLKEPGKFFAVNFTTGTFKPYKFNYYLSDIEKYLNSRFPGDTAHFLEIRDTKTSGLTGCTHKADIKREDHGNFFKLIYDSGKNQTQEGAGGNWGYGKSVYYRVGIGIVIFYSRIKTNKGYESRLIVTLVENEEKKNPDGSDATILNRLEPNSAGKAWWGIREGEDLLPITDNEFIIPVLESFGLKPFKADETGTSIIIPYINPKKLLEDIVPAEVELEAGVKDHFTTVWTSRLEDYLRLAIQRWYAPKIHKDSLPKEYQGRIVIKVSKAKTDELVSSCKEQAALEPQYGEPWIVFDRDRVVRFDEIIKQARREGVHVGWSNPCIEIWFDAYFGKMHSYQDSVTCCREFGATFEKKTGHYSRYSFRC